MLKTKIIDQDSSFRLARTIRLSVNSKDMIAPKRALSASRGKYSNESSINNHAIRGFIEVYRHLNPEKLYKMMHDNDEINDFSYMISSSLRDVDMEKEIIVGILEYNSEGKKPRFEETELLLDLLNNPRFDIVTAPIIPKLPYEKYTQFLDEFIDIYQSTSFIPILAPCIPHYSRVDILRLFEYYAKKDDFIKNFICVDFNGSNPISQYTFVSMIVREAKLLEREFGEPAFLHALNLKYGKATKKQDVVPAKDLVIYTMGFNSFGANHKILRIPEYVGNYELKTKLLNRNDYGYYSLEIVDNTIKETKLHIIKLRNVLSDGKLAKLFNAERHGLESNDIRETINEHEYKKYLESKKHIIEQKTILKKISKVQTFAMQQKLSGLL